VALAKHDRRHGALQQSDPPQELTRGFGVILAGDVAKNERKLFVPQVSFGLLDLAQDHEVEITNRGHHVPAGFDQRWIAANEQHRYFGHPL
jgi:hypothetical protein